MKINKMTSLDECELLESKKNDTNSNTNNNNNNDNENRADEVADNNKCMNKLIKPKTYRTKNTEFYCKTCDIYCNGQLQFEVHMLSQKHKLVTESLNKIEENVNNNNNNNKNNTDENNNSTCNSEMTNDYSRDASRILLDFKKIRITDFAQNLIATQCNVDAEKYLIPEEKKIGKYEKFGFYCPLCDAYMTGQIQLVMHVKGAKHQFYNPSEIPGYKPSKVFNPNSSNHRNRSDSQSIPSSSSDIQVNPMSVYGNNVNQNRVYNQSRQQYLINSNNNNINNINNGSYSDYLLKNQQLMNTYRYHQPTSNGSASLYQFFNSINTKSFADMFNLAKSNTSMFDNSFLNQSSSSSIGGTTTNSSMNSSVNYSPPQAQQYQNSALLMRGFKPIVTANQINGSQYRSAQQQQSNNLDTKINGRSNTNDLPMNQIFTQQPHYHYQSAPPPPSAPSHLPATIHHLQYIQPQYKHFNQISLNHNVVNPTTPLAQNPATSQTSQQQTPRTPGPPQIAQMYFANNQSTPLQTSTSNGPGAQTTNNMAQTYYVNV